MRITQETLNRVILIKSIIETLGWLATIVAAGVSVYCASAVARSCKETAALVNEQTTAFKTICGAKTIEILEE